MGTPKNQKTKRGTNSGEVGGPKKIPKKKRREKKIGLPPAKRGNATEPDPLSSHAILAQGRNKFVARKSGIPQWHLGKWSRRLNPRNPGSLILSHIQIRRWLWGIVKAH